MTRGISAFFLLCSLFSAFAQPGSSSTNHIKMLLDSAKELRYAHLESAFSYANQAFEISDSLQLDSLKAHALAELAVLFSLSATYDRAYELNYLALELAEKYKDTVVLIDAYNNLGIDSYYLEDDAKAKKFFMRVLDLSQAIRDHERIGNSYNNLGLVAAEEGDPQAEIGYYLKALGEFEKIDDRRGIAMINLNIGSVYLLEEDYEQAQTYLAKAVTSYRNLQNFAGLTDAQSGMVSLLEEQNRLGEAIALAENTYDYTIKNNYRSGELHMLGLLNHLYEKKGDYKKAHSAITQLMALNDSVRSEQSAETIAELEAKYESEKREQKISALQMENQLSQLKIQTQSNQRNLLVLFLTLFVLLAIFLFWQYSYKQKTNKLLSDKNLTITKALDEREILLKEIHHRVKNNLQVISSLLNLQSKFIKDQGAIDAVKEGQNRVKSMALIHQKLYQEDNLAGVDAWEYFSSLGNSLIKSYGSDSELELETQQLKLDIDTAIPIGLIINEIVSNSLKYAFQNMDEGLLKITMKEEHETLLLNVSDNGSGFDPGLVASSGSFGMTLIESLAQKLKATYTIDHDAGTNYLFTIKNYKLI